jgi:hypothetical protein
MYSDVNAASNLCKKKKKKKKIEYWVINSN